MRATGIAILLVGVALGTAHAAEDQLVGAAKVRAPDMLVIAGTRLKLSGVLPPDENAACNDGSGNTVRCTDAADAALGEIVGDAAVTCFKERRLGHGYFLGHCRTAGGVDPAEVLLSRGLLQLAPDTPLERYAKATEAAKAAGVGLWGK